MSLIHDALKKAEPKDSSQLGSGISMFQEPGGPHKQPPTKRIAVLSLILLVALGFIAYKKFYSPAGQSETPPPAVGLNAAAPAAPASTGDAADMKRAAVESYKSGDYDSAWTKLSAAAQLAPNDPEVFNNMGLVAKKRGDADKARESYQKALTLKPDYAEALNNLGLLEFEAGDSAKAKEDISKALALTPAYPEANFNLGLIYERANDKKKAVEYYKRFIEVSGSFPSNVVETVRDHVMELEP